MVIGRNVTVSPGAKKPQTRSLSCGLFSDCEFIFVSISMIGLPEAPLRFDDEDLKQLIFEVMGNSGDPLPKRNHRGEFRRKGTDAG